MSKQDNESAEREDTPSSATGQARTENESGEEKKKTTVVTSMLTEARLPDIQDENTLNENDGPAGEQEERRSDRYPAAPYSTPNHGGPVSERGYGAPEYGYNQGQNSSSNPGGRGYGQNYGQYHHNSYNRRNYNPREYQGEYDPHYERAPRHNRYNEREQGAYRDDRGNSYYNEPYYERARYRGEEDRRDSDRRYQDYHDQRYDNRYNDYRGQGRYEEYRDNVDRGYYRDRYREEERGQSGDHYQSYNRRDDEWAYNNPQYRDYGYQAGGQTEGFGMRDSRRHRGRWEDLDDYPEGHVHQRPGRGRYGSR